MIFLQADFWGPTKAIFFLRPHYIILSLAKGCDYDRQLRQKTRTFQPPRFLWTPTINPSASTCLLARRGKRSGNEEEELIRKVTEPRKKKKQRKKNNAIALRLFPGRFARLVGVAHGNSCATGRHRSLAPRHFYLVISYFVPTPELSALCGADWHNQQMAWRCRSWRLRISNGKSSAGSSYLHKVDSDQFLLKQDYEKVVCSFGSRQNC